MNKKKPSELRRNLLKSLAAGTGAVVAGKSLPEKWSKPVVDSVLLPAHAQTSPPPPTNFNYFGVNVTSAGIESDSRFAEFISNTLIDNAHAGDGPPGGNPIIEMSAAVDGPMATVLFTPSRDPAFAWALFQSDLPTDGTEGSVILGPGGDCGTAPWPSEGGPQGVRIIGYTPGDPSITVEIRGGLATRQYVLSEGAGTATAVTCDQQPG